MDRPFDLASHVVRLGPAGAAEAVALTPAFFGGSTSSGPEDRFVGIVAFDSPDALHPRTLERHPAADELLLVLEGALALVVEAPGSPGGERRVELAAGEAYLVPRGLWHRLEMLRPGRLLFVNSRHRMESRRLPRESEPKQEEPE